MMHTEKRLDPKEFNLSPRLDLRQNNDGSIVIVKDRKSRIIMQDGRRLAAQVNAIRKIYPHTRISILTTAPVCSKTRTFLEQAGIEISTL